MYDEQYDFSEEAYKESKINLIVSDVKEFKFSDMYKGYTYALIVL